MKQEMNRFLLKTAFFVLPVLIGFECLFHLGFTPIVTSSIFFDNKTLLLQKHPVKNVGLLAVGSSMTLYSLNSPIIAQNIHLPYYNFGSWNLQMGETRIWLNHLVSKYHPQYVLICSTFGDFSQPTNTTYLNYTTAPSYIRERFPELFFLTDFHPLHQIALRRSAVSFLLEMDKWGGGTGIFKITTAKPPPQVENGIWGKFLAFGTPAMKIQFREFDSLCTSLQEKKIKLIFVQAPIESTFIGTDSLRKLVADHSQKCQAIVESHGGAYLNYCDAMTFPDSLFQSPLHLTAEGAKFLTTKLVADLKTIIPE